jgi:hypothetical protein
MLSRVESQMREATSITYGLMVRLPVCEAHFMHTEILTRLVLVIVAALWNQVEYRTKHAMPFSVLQKGPTPASETLLLDYVTPGKPEALMKALRKSHWPVVIAIVNSLLITLLTVASTGLLVLQETSFTRHDCRLNVTDNFVPGFETSKVGSAAVLATIAISNETIPLPPGTSRKAAFQSLGAPASLYRGMYQVSRCRLCAKFYLCRSQKHRN